jgi:DNA-binding transcriptional ArsR family regulator
MTTSIRDVMPAPPRLRVEAVAAPALELLIGLYAATTPAERHAPSWVPDRDEWSTELDDAVAGAGDRSGEAWLHLLGLALEPHEDAGSFVDAVARVPPRELRRHLVGVNVPAWVGMVGAETLERAAAGDGNAIAVLLAHPRYYAGRAAESLGPLLTLPARETKARVVAVLRRFYADAFAPQEANVVTRLREQAAAVNELSRALAPEDVVPRATGGYLYEPEPEFDRVVLVPHFAARPSLLLCQHRTDRVICYPIADEPADPELALTEHAVAVGRALGDERRVQILRRLALGNASLDELAETTGLARSTAHHHLALLRAAGLVILGGNARGYWYALRPQGLSEAQRILQALSRGPAHLPRRERPDAARARAARRAPRAREKD